MNDVLLATTNGLPADWPQQAAWLFVQAVVGVAAALLLIGATYRFSRRRARRPRSRPDVRAF